jgi:hypothetical protein
MGAPSWTKKQNSGLTEHVLDSNVCLKKLSLREGPTEDKTTSRIACIINFHENLAAEAKTKAESEIVWTRENQSNSRRGEGRLPQEASYH